MILCMSKEHNIQSKAYLFTLISSLSRASIISVFSYDHGAFLMKAKKIAVEIFSTTCKA